MPDDDIKLPPRRHAERLTEQRSPRTRLIDRASIPEALAMLHAEDRLCCDASEKVAPQVAHAIELVVTAFRAGGRLIYIGAGTSGRLGVLDASEQPPTFGVPRTMVQGVIAGGSEALVRSIEGAEDRAEDGARAVRELALGPNDVLMGIASGGRTPYVLGALAEARRLCSKTILLACTPPLEGEDQLADCQIHALVGPEPITGSTRMKSGTVTKLILNQITTLSMVQIGKVYENLMVDLKPTNDKLRDRATRILSELAGLPPEAAQAKLNQADWELKVAIVMAIAGSDPNQARLTLNHHGGHVASAIRTLRNT